MCCGRDIEGLKTMFLSKAISPFVLDCGGWSLLHVIGYIQIIRLDAQIRSVRRCTQSARLMRLGATAWRPSR